MQESGCNEVIPLICTLAIGYQDVNTPWVSSGFTMGSGRSLTAARKQVSLPPWVPSGLTIHGGFRSWWLWRPLFTEMAGKFPFLNGTEPSRIDSTTSLSLSYCIPPPSPRKDHSPVLLSGCFDLWFLHRVKLCLFAWLNHGFSSEIPARYAPLPSRKEDVIKKQDDFAGPWHIDSVSHKMHKLMVSLGAFLLIFITSPLNFQIWAFISAGENVWFSKQVYPFYQVNSLL